MVEKFRNYIERGTWEEDLKNAGDLLDLFCVAFFALALFYFGPALVQIVLREVSR